MKIVNKKKFIRSLVLIFIFLMFIIFSFINKSFSHSEVSYQKLYVSSGDTLWDIARQQQNNNQYFENKDIRDVIDEIKYINNLNTSNLNVGDELSIPTI